MIYAYDEMYIYDAMRNLGEAFDYAVNSCKIDADTFSKLFVASGYAELFETGTAKIVSGLSGTELVMNICEKSGIDIDFPEIIIDYERSAEYWCGWVLGFYQWKTKRSFKDIFTYIDASQIVDMYYPLHEASEEKFVDVLNGIISSSQTVTKLQRQRKLCGYSQRELSEKSGVNLRTLQQYELGSKDICKASITSVLALARVLGCNVNDILETPDSD